MSLWLKFTDRKIKRGEGGINLPLAFTQTTNVTLRPNLPPPTRFLPLAESTLLLTGTNDTCASPALNIRYGARE